MADCTARAVTLVLPTPIVQNLLPHGLRLGPQDFTPEGTHPISLWFYDMFGLHMNIPTLLPSMSYNEHVLGIPYCYTTDTWRNYGAYGPFFYMATLQLNNWLALLGGRMFWGFEKTYGDITTTSNSFVLSSPSSGRPLISLQYAPATRRDYRPIIEYPNFRFMYELLQQPLISIMPFGYGPFFVASEFTRLWSRALIQPIRSVTTIHQSYVPGLPTGRFPRKGSAPGIHEHSTGSFILRMRYACGLIYPIWFNPTRRTAPEGAVHRQLDGATAEATASAVE